MCEIDDCHTRLSKYNRNERCWPHRAKQAPRLRGQTEEERRAKLPRCKECIGAVNSAESLRQVEVEGALHIEGRGGSGTLCESFSQ